MKLRFLPLFLLLLSSGLHPAAAASTNTYVSIDVWRHLPVLNNGRVMPIDSYARHTLLGFSGRSTFERKPASLWLARVLFTPEAVRDDAVFLVNHPEVVEALGITAEGRNRYSYNQLLPALSELARLARAAYHLENDARSPVENEIMGLYNNLHQFGRLLQAFDFAIPQADFTIASDQLRNELGLGASGPVTFLDLLKQTSQIDALMKTRRAEGDELARLSMTMRMWQRQHNDLPPALIPVSTREGPQWISAWQALNTASDQSDIMVELAAIQDMAVAFRDGKQAAFDLAARTFLNSTTKRISDPAQISMIKHEVRYNQSEALYRSELLYGLAFIVALLSVPFRGRWTYRIAFMLLLLALIPHTYSIVARMIIMGRPPVTNLYSTFVFVSWTCALIGLTVEYIQRSRLGLITGAAMGLALLMTAARFGSEGDTMGVMVAVLDSNFWLATHVVTISIGYAGCCASALLGHIYLLQAIRQTPDHPALKETDRAVYGAQAFGLIFTYLGTMLGGVWADQSWGRFWGWDPKENGALVIVLWSALLFHARVGRMIGPRLFAAGSVLGMIAVLCAWIGVNLLGVGLHSYGFTSGLARGLAIATIFEVVFVLVTVPLAKKQKKKDV